MSRFCAVSMENSQKWHWEEAFTKVINSHTPKLNIFYDEIKTSFQQKSS